MTNYKMKELINVEECNDEPKWYKLPDEPLKIQARSILHGNL